MKNDAPTDCDTHARCDAELARAIVTIISVDGPTAFVEIAGGAACSRCAGAGGCGTKSLLAIFGKKSIALKIDNRIGAAIGDQVEIGIEQSTILKLSALSYLLPLIGLTGGGAIGAAADAGDLVSFGIGVIGLVVGFVYSRHLYTSEKWEREISPILLRRVSSGDDNYIKLEAIR